MFFAMLAIDILTALGDVLLLGLNKRAKRRYLVFKQSGYEPKLIGLLETMCELCC